MPSKWRVEGLGPDAIEMACRGLGPDAVRKDLLQQPVGYRDGALASFRLARLAPRAERHKSPGRASGKPQQRLDSVRSVTGGSGRRRRLGVHVACCAPSARPLYEPEIPSTRSKPA